MKVKLKVNVRAAWPRKIFDKDLIVRDGRAKIDLPEIPFNAKELTFDVSILLILRYTLKIRS